jgi:hypothetical protein
MPSIDTTATTTNGSTANSHAINASDGDAKYAPSPPPFIHPPAYQSSDEMQFTSPLTSPTDLNRQGYAHFAYQNINVNAADDQTQNNIYDDDSDSNTDSNCSDSESGGPGGYESGGQQNREHSDPPLGQHQQQQHQHQQPKRKPRGIASELLAAAHNLSVEVADSVHVAGVPQHGLTLDHNGDPVLDDYDDDDDGAV